MFLKRHYQNTIVKLKHRIEELEERLCPCEQHQWILTGFDNHGDDYQTLTTFYKYRCKRCGKKTVSILPTLEK